MKARVYKNNGERYAFVMGTLYKLDESNNVVSKEQINIFKFLLETYKGNLTMGKLGYQKTYEFVNIDKEAK